jgi:hypothetical protein
MAPGDDLVWTFEFVGKLSEIREHYETDCRAHAWFQFGRAPAYNESTLYDMRFSVGRRSNFTQLERSGATQSCQGLFTSWDAPREDLLRTE